MIRVYIPPFKNHKKEATPYLTIYYTTYLSSIILSPALSDNYGRAKKGSKSRGALDDIWIIEINVINEIIQKH
jgi:hypothetical protein